MFSYRSGLLYLCFVFIFSGCIGMPEGVKPVTNYQLDRYLGTWYEVARLDHSFERGLEQVTAEYSLHEDGGVKVFNKGYSTEEGKWKEAEGKAYFVDQEDLGHLKVSFFGPFYSSYVVFDFNPDQEDYEYAYISGYNNSYLWLLSRTATVSEERLNHFVESATDLGFDTESLIYVSQETE